MLIRPDASILGSDWTGLNQVNDHASMVGRSKSWFSSWGYFGFKPYAVINLPKCFRIANKIQKLTGSAK